MLRFSILVLVLSVPVVWIHYGLSLAAIPVPAPPAPPPPTPKSRLLLHTDQERPPPLPRLDPQDLDTPRPLLENELALVRQHDEWRPWHLADTECLSLDPRPGPVQLPLSSLQIQHAKPRVPLYALMQYPNVMDKLGVAGVPYRIAPDQSNPRSRPRIGRRQAEYEELHRRQREYHYSLARVLWHPSVRQVHILLNRTADLDPMLRGLGQLCPKDLRGLPLYKLRVRALGRMMTYGQAFQHANEWLADRHVLLMNSDVYPVGSGWLRLKPEHFGERNRTLFMISRFSPACPAVGATGPRDERSCRWASGIGSADAFVFVAPVPDKVVKEMLRFPTNYWGAENRAAASLNRAGFRNIVNPCNVLELWHEHCTRVRTSGTKVPRINRGAGMSKTAPYSAALPFVPPPHHRPRKGGSDH